VSVVLVLAMKVQIVSPRMRCGKPERGFRAWYDICFLFQPVEVEFARVEACDRKHNPVTLSSFENMWRLAQAGFSNIEVVHSQLLSGGAFNRKEVLRPDIKTNEHRGSARHNCKFSKFLVVNFRMAGGTRHREPIDASGCPVIIPARLSFFLQMSKKSF